MRLIRLLIGLVLTGALIYVVVAVPLGQKTTWQHLRAIAGSKESQDLVEEVKQKTGFHGVSDAGPASQDRLTAQERKLLRKLLREKLGEQAAPDSR